MRKGMELQLGTVIWNDAGHIPWKVFQDISSGGNCHLRVQTLIKVACPLHIFSAVCNKVRENIWNINLSISESFVNCISLFMFLTTFETVKSSVMAQSVTLLNLLKHYVNINWGLALEVVADDVVALRKLYHFKANVIALHLKKLISLDLV